MTTVPYTFGNESSPIPLSQLDANFAVMPNYANTAGIVINSIQDNITGVGTLAVLSVAGNITTGNITSLGSLSAGNVSIGNIAASGNLTGVNNITALGNITGASFYSYGMVNVNSLISASGNVTGGNLLTAGNISGANITAVGFVNASANISTTGNVLSQGQMSAIGNILTAGYFIGTFQGNISGNVSGLPPLKTTQVLFNSAGNVDSAGGLTYTTSPNALGVLGTFSAQGNIISTGNLSLTSSATIGGNASIGGNVTIGGIAQITGVVTGPTAPTGTANNQLATTVFVNNAIINATASLGTMSQQNANNVSITGGNITVTAINTAAWTIREFSGTLYFQHSGTNVAKLDSSGNFTTIGNVTAFGTL